MITKFNLINEALTQKMFHFTNIKNLVNILKEDAFFTTPVIGTNSDSKVNNGKFYYFAMQTSRHGKVAFADSIGRSGKVCINIDGQKLNQNFKSKRVDYWEISRNPKDHEKRNYMHNLTRFDELEERIITNKPEIPNAKKYIEEVHILLTDNMPNYISKNIIELKKYISDNVYFYDEEKYFNNQVKNKSIDISDIDFEKDLEDTTPYVNYYIPLTRIISLMIISDDKLKNEIFKWLKNSKEVKKILNDRNTQFKGTTSVLPFSKLLADIEKKSKKDYDWSINYRGDFYLDDYLRGISADIHNKKSDTNKISRYILQMLTKDMSKHKVKNLKSYIEYKREITKTNEKVLYVDEHYKNIVFDNGTYQIAVDNPDNATYVTLWYEGKRVGTLKADVTERRFRNLEDFKKYLKIGYVNIDNEHQGQRFGLKMYQALIDHVNPKIESIYSHLPDRSNRNQIPKIYKRLGSYKEGDYEFIDIKK